MYKDFMRCFAAWQQCGDREAPQQATNKCRTHALLFGTTGKRCAEMNVCGYWHWHEGPATTSTTVSEQIFWDSCSHSQQCAPHGTHKKSLQWIVFDGFHLLNHPFLGEVNGAMVQWCNGAMVQPAAWRPLTDLTVELRQPLSDSEGAHWHPEWVAWAAPSRHITTYHDISWQQAWHGKIDKTVYNHI